MEDDPRLTVHTNVILVRADSPEDAYAKAIELGAELIYSERTDMDDAAIEKYVSSKEGLGVFANRKRFPGPNYSSKDVLQQLQVELPTLTFGEDGEFKF